ncbi:hypothetical protein Tco_1301679 [Tanacetum coccineum]|uniref:Uncharacterized protein n=1 Tax=Tanacetum coccineum TaxID=301880 RepID=A0ABQ5IP90_9ASTR
MGYHLYNSYENKVSIARYAELLENSLKFTRSSGSLTLLKVSGSNVDLQGFLMICLYIIVEDYELEDHVEPAKQRRCIIRSWI